MTELPDFKFCFTPELIAACQKKDRDPLEFLPTRAENLSSGWDVKCAEVDGVELKPGCYVKISLGFKVFAPDGWWLKLVPRSSTFIKKHIHSLYGTIDESYEGIMYFCGQFLPDSCKELINVNRLPMIEFGDRIAQLIPIHRKEMNVSSVSEEEFAQLSQNRNSSRQRGGFGSTGDR